MHETARAQSILNAVMRQKEEKNLGELKEVIVAINPAAGVDEEELAEIIEEMKDNTPFKDTIFSFKQAGLKATCSACGSEFTISSPSDACPNCGSQDIELSLIDDWQIVEIK